MREIKFRAWDGKKVEELQAINLDGYAYFNFGCHCCGDSTGVAFGDNKPGVVMQYTGLKDKNGKEIYEGDIVVSNTIGKNTRRVIGVVEYWKIGFAIKENGVDENWRWGLEKAWEAIGNIYENPELLKAKE